MKRETVYVILAVIWAVCATSYTLVMAATSYSVHTPFIADLYAAPSDLKVDAVSFSFNVYTSRYDNATLDVKNYDDSATHSGTIFITLYSANNTEIATGTAGTGTISPGVRVGVTVHLTWVGAYTVKDFGYGKIILSQTG